ncbi:hypothetical protein ACIPWL_22365 [Streptomyces sp. NPDC090023]
MTTQHRTADARDPRAAVISTMTTALLVILGLAVLTTSVTA